MNDASEITILKEGNVKITNRRAIIGTKSYTMSNIISVNMRVNEPKMFIPLFFTVNMGFCSVLIALSNLQEYAQYLQMGLYTGITAILLFIISRKTKYSVQIKSAVGNIRILEANDRDAVERIVTAINQAIVLQE